MVTPDIQPAGSTTRQVTAFSSTALRCSISPSLMSFLCPAAPPASGCLSILGGEPALPALPRLLRGAVTLLVITNDLGRVLQLGRPAQLLQPLRADPIEPAADLLRRHLPVFPPAG